MNSIEGNITDNAQMLIINESTAIKGDIKAHHLKIYGQIEGNIQSSGTVTIYSGAAVQGKINSKELIIHPGAKVKMVNKKA